METIMMPCEALDKDNQAWTVKYLTRLDGLLKGEKDKPEADSCYCRFLEGEIQAYQDLLSRCSSN